MLQLYLTDNTLKYFLKNKNLYLFNKNYFLKFKF